MRKGKVIAENTVHEFSESDSADAKRCKGDE
jgi:hypothetical protein